METTDQPRRAGDRCGGDSPLANRDTLRQPRRRFVSSTRHDNETPALFPRAAGVFLCLSGAGHFSENAKTRKSLGRREFLSPELEAEMPRSIRLDPDYSDWTKAQLIERLEKIQRRIAEPTSDERIRTPEHPSREANHVLTTTASPRALSCRASLESSRSSG